MFKDTSNTTFLADRAKVICHRLKMLMVKETLPLSGFKYKPCGYERTDALPAVTPEWHDFEPGMRWGGEADTHAWFRGSMSVPAHFCGDGLRPELFVSTGPDGWDATNPQLVCYIDGKLTQGMDVNHKTVAGFGSGTHDLCFYAYSGMVSSLAEFLPQLQLIDTQTETLHYHIRVALDVLNYTDEFSKPYIDLMGHVNAAINLLDLRAEYTSEYYASVAKAIAYLEENVYNKTQDGDTAVICIGHTHIDVAWMWTLAQTREKTVRSFATVVNLMKQYPDYKFMSSQAALYDFLKEENPELFEEVKALVREGRWEVEGAMWVEADCNLISGESMVRQLLYGKRFFQNELGADCKVLWLPDVFGYSAAMPQILRQAGVDKFLTSKISWSETNAMPNDVFMWQGIDGTEIFSCFLTAQEKRRNAPPWRWATYNAVLNAPYIAGTWDRMQNKDLINEGIITFGYGDGGGGPTPEMLEHQARLGTGISGCPTAKIEFAGAFLERAKEKVEANERAPKWVGELYLEYHRGTYTSIAEVKRNNRKSEFLFQIAELLGCTDMLLNGGTYAQDTLNSGWKTILTNQFHDIIPGSSIREVYEESARQFGEIMPQAEALCEASRENIAKNIKTDGGVLVFNPNAFENSDVVDIDGRKMFAGGIPAKGYKVISPICGGGSVVAKQAMENDFFAIEFDDSYNISRIYDKRNDREVLKHGKAGNMLQAFEDYPRDFDAWEISNYYDQKMWPVDDVDSVELLDEGARKGLCIRRKFMQSTITQRIYIYDDIAKVDFDTHIDWKQHHILLKAAFPVDVHASEATYDIQFGNVKRPTHANTSWDAAKFEVCAHKFADVSESGYGVSLLNDCKYGYDIKGSDMRITMLKSATEPNPDADKCEHNFTYSLYPHSGDFAQSDVYRMAYALNMPMSAQAIAKQDGTLADSYSLVNADCDNVIIDTVKKAEDSDDIIVRMFECYNKRANANIHFGFDVASVEVCDLMENAVEPLDFADNAVKLAVKPFEIITLKVRKR